MSSGAVVSHAHSPKNVTFVVADEDYLVDLPALDYLGYRGKVVVRMLVLDVHEHAQQLATIHTHEKDEEERADEYVRLCEEKVEICKRLHNTLALYE